MGNKSKKYPRFNPRFTNNFLPGSLTGAWTATRASTEASNMQNLAIESNMRKSCKSTKYVGKVSYRMVRIGGQKFITMVNMSAKYLLGQEMFEKYGKYV